MKTIVPTQKTKSYPLTFSTTTKEVFQKNIKRKRMDWKANKTSFSNHLAFALILMFTTLGMQAATITSTATGGTWASGSTWVGGVVPATGDTVIIATTGAGSVNIGATLTQTATGSVTVNNGAKLTMSAGTITFGSLTINSGGTATLKRNTIILGATNITGRINFGATSITAQTITFTGAVTLNAGAVWDETNAGANTVKDTYVFINNFTNNATTFTPLVGSKHNFTGTGTLSGSTITAMPTATFTAAYTNNGVFTSATILTVTGVTLTNNGTITATTSLAGTGGLTQGSSAVLNIGRTSAITTLTATASGNTVNYTGAAQTIHTGNYSILNFSGSGNKTLTTGTTTIGALTISGTAITTTVANLAITNNLTINSGTKFTTGATYSQSVGGTTTVSGTLTLGGTGTKTFTGDVTLNAGGVWNETGVATININGNFTNNATTFTASTGVHNFTGVTKTISGVKATLIPTATFTGDYTINNVFTSSTLLTITGATVTNNSTITATASLTGTGRLVQGAAGILKLGGTVGITALNASAAGNTVNYTGASQTGFVTTYSTLILSGSGTKTFATSPTINTLLSMEGTAISSIAPIYGSNATLQYNTTTARAAGVVWITPFVATGGIVIKNTGAITTPGAVQIGNNTNVPLNINAGATLTPGANLITFHGDFIKAGTLTSGTGGITIAGTTATQSIAGCTTTGAVTFTKTSGTATMVGNIIGKALTINGAGGTLNLGVGLTHTFTGVVTLTAGVLNGGSSTINENTVSTTAWNGTGSVFVPANSTVNFGAAGAQTIAANSSFYNLSFSGSGIKTVSYATTIANNIAISGTAVANLGAGLTHTAISLTLGGTTQVFGTWGSTASSAANKNATWFGSTATGTIILPCFAPSAPTSGGDKTTCSNATIPTLTATVSAGQVVDWYNQVSGGTLLLSGSTSYTPTVAGTYFAETRNTSTGCLSASRTGVTLTINPSPIVLALTGSAICASPGGDGTITSTTSDSAINYQLYDSSNVAVQATIAGTGTALSWTALTAGTGYYVIETDPTSGCSTTSGTVNVSTNANPNALVLSGSTICESLEGEGTITSTTSQTGVEYQLYDSSDATLQSTQLGTGSALTWSNLNSGSGYYIIGTNSSTGCISSNSNTANISTVSNPIALVITGSTICASPGGNGTITSTTSEVGVNYQLNDNLGNDIGPLVSGTGAALIFTGIPAGTGYYVDATNSTTGCDAPSSNAVDVLTNPNPLDKTVTVSSASVCSGTGVNIIVAGSLATENYQLRDNSSNTNIGGAITGNGSTLNLPSGNLASTTTCNVIATITATGCSTQLTNTPSITVNPNLPASVSVGATATTICSGASVTFTATPTNGGTTPSYQWKLNGANVGTNSATYTSTTLANGNTVSVVMTSNATPCLTSSPATSNTVTMTVNPNLPASVSIGATATTICSGTSVTFTATPTNGGTTPSYQWKLNGANVGTNSATYTSTTLANGNTVSVVMTSNATPCLTSSPATSNTVTMTVNPNLPASVSIVSSDADNTISAGTSVTFTATPINGGSSPSYQWQLNGTNVGTNSSSYTTTTLTTGQIVRVIMTSNATPCLSGSPATSNSITTVVHAISVAGTVSANQTICVGSLAGDITLTGNTGTIQWQSSTNNTTFSNISGATSAILTSAAIGTLTVTTYFRAIVTNGVSAPVTSGTVIVTIGSSTWNGTSWSNGVPTSTTAAIFTGNYTSSINGGNINACTLTVASGTVIISSGNNVSLNGALNVISGSFTLENNANLIQSTNVSNSGNIIIKKNTPALMRQDYVLWSSPVAGQQLLAFSPATLTNRFYTYDWATDKYASIASPSSTNFATGTGYLIRVPNTHPTTPTVWGGQFVGVPNNGTVNIAVTNGTYNAIGNPYPSTINADRFITDNNITEALYFWRKTNNSANSSYATYTLAGGVKNCGGDPLSLTPNGTIAVGQGFIVKSTSTKLSFTNSMRTVSNNAPFLRMAQEKSRIWLNLSNVSGDYYQTMVAYMPNATAGVDAAIDGRFLNDTQTALTSLINGSEYTIQGRALPFNGSDIVPLSFKAKTADSYSITLGNFDGLFSNQDVFIKDNLTNTVHNLKSGAYTFASEAGTFTSRFEIVYQNSTLSTQTPTFNINSVVVYKQNQELVINSGTTIMSNVKVYDLAGRLLLSKNNINASQIKLFTGTTQEVLIVKITSDSDGIVTKKIIN